MVELEILNKLFSQFETTLITEKCLRNDILIAAPHHAIGGVKELHCSPNRASDENTGLIAYEIAKKLNCSFVIACNATSDPNKSLETDYSKQIIEWSPKYLIEIHGHGGKRGREKVIEISSGSKVKNKFSNPFASTLQSILTNLDNLNELVIKGNFDEIYFKATNTATIIDNRWIAFHIELPPSLRLNYDKNLPENCSEFIKALSDTISEKCI
jgi:hypothetical protein